MVPRSLFIKLPTWQLSHRQFCDLEMILNGGFSPLNGFLTSDQYYSVCDSMRLTDGKLWSLPITLDVTREFAKGLSVGDEILLTNKDGYSVATLKVEDIYQPDITLEAKKVYGTESKNHPGVKLLFENTNPIYIGGLITEIQMPEHHDFASLRRTPAELKIEFEKLGWDKIVAFQTRNPMHRAHVELTLKAAEMTGAKILIHPVVGASLPGDIDPHIRVLCYNAVIKHYPPGQAMLSLLPLAMRMAGPKEAILHAIIRKNYGCTHFIVGRDHAGPGFQANGESFYPEYAAQELLIRHQEEIGLEVLTFDEMVYAPKRKCYMPLSQSEDQEEILRISGADLRNRLRSNADIPEWFTYPEVAKILQDAHPVKSKQGLVLFFTGLSGSGKSSLALALKARLMEIDSRLVNILDGDLVRSELSPDLGYSKSDRDLNVKRIGYLASEISRNRGIVVCAQIAPYDAARKEVRQRVSEHSQFCLIHICTSLAICEKRDPKGLYSKARTGIIQSFTGVSDVYETPQDAELIIDSGEATLTEAVQIVIDYLRSQKLIE